ncbi:hypothetical protein QK908_14405 [Lactococcus cremoris]
MTYQTSTENKAIEIVNIKSLEGKVKESRNLLGIKEHLVIYEVVQKMNGQWVKIHQHLIKNK